MRRMEDVPHWDGDQPIIGFCSSLLLSQHWQGKPNPDHVSFKSQTDDCRLDVFIQITGTTWHLFFTFEIYPLKWMRLGLPLFQTVFDTFFNIHLKHLLNKQDFSACSFVSDVYQPCLTPQSSVFSAISR